MNHEAMNAPSIPVGQRLLLQGHFSAPVLVEAVKLVGDVVAVQVRADDGLIHETFLTPEEMDQLLQQISSPIHPSARWGHPEELRLLIESRRIGLAYAYDPHFAVSLSGIRSLPHQLEAVYGNMLPQARLRFLLADDPGAGKTVMTGLLLKELKLRGAIERALIIVPAALTIQWQDELLRFFNEFFVIINAENDRQQLGNLWVREPQVITSMDYAKQEGVRERVWAAGWDLVVVDEAHKCSAYTKVRSGRAPEVQKTERYQLAEHFSHQPNSMLLFLTATPHQGDEDHFAHFLHLLDPDLFPEPHKLDDNGRGLHRAIFQLGKDSPWVLRRLKEDLRDFNGRRLFPDRHSRTVTFILSPDEYRLYFQVNAYLNRFLTGGSGAKKQSIALTLQRSFGERLWAAQRRAMDLRGRYEEGEKEVALALQEAEREVEDLERRQRERLEQLRFLEVVRPGPVRYLGSFFVVPAGQVIDLGALAEDLEAKARSERLAMQIVMDYERRRGWEPVDVSAEKVGFDIRSLSPADPMTGRRDIRRIEVKGRRGGEPVRLTENEWRKARQLRDTY